MRQERQQVTNNLRQACAVNTPKPYLHPSAENYALAESYNDQPERMPTKADKTPRISLVAT